MRKTIAGLLIRAAHRIYRPKVTGYRSAGVYESTVTWDLPTSTHIIVGGGGGAGGTPQFNA